MKISLFNTFLMLTLIVLWGSSFIVVKIALDDGLTPIAVATFRFLVAGGLFFTILLKKNWKYRNILPVERRDLPILLILALSGVTFFFTAQYTGIQMASPSVAAIFVCLLSPIVIAVFSTILLHERLTKKQVLGIAIAPAGTYITITGGSLSFSGGENFLFGGLVLLTTPFLWSIYSLLGKRLMEKYDPFDLAAIVTILGALCLLPFSVLENSLAQILTMSLRGWLAILYLSITCSLLGYYIWMYVLKEVGATITSSFLFAEPLVTIMFGVFFIQESLNAFIYAGTLLIFLGVYLATTR